MMLWPSLLGLLLLAEPARHAAPNCGVESVLMLRDALGGPVADADADRLIADHPGQTVSLAEVRDMAGALGIALAGFKASPAELIERGDLCIVHFSDPEHFACLVGLDAQWAQFVDVWHGAPRVVDRAWFDAHFTGACLLRDPPPAAGGPRLRAASHHGEYAAGEAGKTVTHRFAVTNTGDAPLTLNASSSSCQCTTVETGRFTVQPGQSVEVPVSLRLSPGHGIMEHVRLATNDPACPVLFLSIRVQSVPQNIVWSPEEVVMGGAPGGKWTARLHVLGPGEFRVLSAHSEPEVCDIVVLERKLGDERSEFTLGLTSVAGLRSGRHEALIMIAYRSGVDGTVPVPVEVVVDPVGIAWPSRVFATQDRPGRWDGQVVVRSAVTGQALPVKDVRVEGLKGVTATLHRVDAGCYRVDINAELAQGVARGKLIVTLTAQAQPELVVPLTFAVGE